MAEQTDIPAWIAGLAALGGGAITALGAMFRPGNNTELEQMKTLIAEFGGRLKSLEDSRAEMLDTLGQIFRRIDEMSGDLKVCRAILDERGKGP